MRARFRSWWRQIQQHPMVAIGLIVALVVVIALISLEIRLYGTGFNGYNKVTIAHTISGTNTGTVIKTEEYQPGKALWDWLQLLIIPLVLAVGALLFNLANTRTEQQIAKQRYEQDQQIALDKQHEDLLQAYLDRMSELLLEKDLRTNPSEEVKNVARVRTITVLTQLNARRIGYVFTFLREAGLMSTASEVTDVDEYAVNLFNADLHAVNWRNADLSDTDLKHVNLSGADLSHARLYETDLSYANLRGANLRGTDLSTANLSYADLRGADLSGAFFKKIVSIKSSSQLPQVNLLFGVNLFGANLSGAKVTEEQLKEAKSLEGATMPDGSKHP